MCGDGTSPTDFNFTFGGLLHYIYNVLNRSGRNAVVSVKSGDPSVLENDAFVS